MSDSDAHPDDDTPMPAAPADGAPVPAVPQWGEGPAYVPPASPRPARTPHPPRPQRSGAGSGWRAADRAPADLPIVQPEDLPTDGLQHDAEGAESRGDALGWTAVVFGCVGIFFLGIVMAVLTGILAAEAGRRARDAGRSQRLAYRALGLAFLDAVIWLVLQIALKPDFIVG